MPKKLTNEEFLSRLYNVNQFVRPLGVYVNNHDSMLFECLIDGHIWKTEAKHILNGHRCPVCAKRVIGPAPEFKNSIFASEHKTYFSEYLTEKQMKSYMPNTHEKIEAICPRCGKSKYISPKELLHTGLCCICGDGQSFPNKFVYNVLDQLNLNMKPEFAPAWAHGKRYDEYLIDYNLIIENHGMHHYQKCSFTNKTLQEEKLNDHIKQKLAEKQHIQYIVLDCRYSSMEYIKQSIMNSPLPQILSFREDDINWKQADTYASGSLLIESAKLFVDGYSVKEIASLLNIRQDKISKYLNKATKLGLCNYEGKLMARKVLSKGIYCVELNMTFVSLSDAARYTNQSPSNISLCARGKTKTASGYHWKFTENN